MDVAGEELQEQPRRPVPDKKTLSPRAQQFLAHLAAVCRSVISDESPANSSSITCSSVTFTSTIELLMKVVKINAWDTTTSFHDDSLESIALRCSKSEDAVSCAQLILMLNFMQFRLKVER